MHTLFYTYTQLNIKCEDNVSEEMDVKTAIA